MHGGGCREKSSHVKHVVHHNAEYTELVHRFMGKVGVWQGEAGPTAPSAAAGSVSGGASAGTQRQAVNLDRPAKL